MKKDDPHARLREALGEMKTGLAPDALLVAIGNCISGASINAAKKAEEDYVLFPIAHPRGSAKYHQIQERFLRLGNELGLPTRAEPHPGGSTAYAVLESDSLRLTLARVSRHHHNPPPRPFRLNSHVKHHRPDQLFLLDELIGSLPEQLVGTIIYGFDRKNPVTPSFLEIRFVDSNGKYMGHNTLDLMALCRAAQAPKIEEVKDNRKTRYRGRQQKQSDSEQA